MSNLSLPSQPFNKRSAWGIKAAIRYPSTTILKLLQLINFDQIDTTPSEVCNSGESQSEVSNLIQSNYLVLFLNISNNSQN